MISMESIFELTVGGVVLVSGKEVVTSQFLERLVQQSPMPVARRDLITISDGLMTTHTSTSAMYRLVRRIEAVSRMLYVMDNYDVAIEVLGTIKTHITLDQFVQSIDAMDIVILTTCNNISNRGVHHIQKHIVRSISLGGEQLDTHQLRRAAAKWCSGLSADHLEFLFRMTIHLNQDDTAASDVTASMRETVCGLLHQKKADDPTRPPEV